jgi:sulfoxide reductase heme-binding subunit YedZ
VSVLATSGSHFFWITSRAAGLAALVLASASVGVGLSMGGRLFKGRGPDLRVIHETLSIATLAAIALHALALLGDSYFHPSIADLVIPFARNYREPYMALGIIAGWGFFLFGLSFYARKRIGISRWKVIHRFTALAWLLGVVHTLGEGSDAGRVWFLIIVAVTVAPPLALLIARLRQGRAGKPAGPSRPAGRPGAPASRPARRLAG